MEELIRLHAHTHKTIFTLLPCHRHLEKHKNQVLHQTPEMIFLPVTTTNVCLRFTVRVCGCVCVCVCVRACVWLCKQRPHAKGFHGRHPQILERVRWAVMAFPVLSSRHQCTHSLWLQHNSFPNMVMEALSDTHTHTHNNKTKSENSSSIQTTLFHLVCLHTAAVHHTDTKNHFAMDSTHISRLLVCIKIHLHSKICHLCT